MSLKEVTLISLTKRKLSGVLSKTNFQIKKKKKTLKGFPSYQIKSQRESLPRKWIPNKSNEKQSFLKKANNEDD